MKTNQVGQSFALKGGGRLNWAYFVRDTKDRIRVTALLGCVSYIDRHMSIEEAREQYRKLTSQGWTPVEISAAQKEMPLHVLNLHIYD